MKDILLIALAGLTALLVIVWGKREHLTTMKSGGTYPVLEQRMDKLETEFEAIQQKIDKQDEAMKQANAQAAAAKASLAAIR